jgi:hypothetical protein
MITNRQLVQYADTLFAHTDAYNFPALFANRHISRQLILNQLAAPRPGFMVVSDILGSGKTFLVNMVLNERKGSASEMGICGRLQPAKFDGKDLIIIDEWDIKAAPKRFTKSLKEIEEFRTKNDTPIILLGDYTLKSENVLKRLGSIAPVEIVPMEPLSPDFFDLAVRQRVARVLNADPDDLGEDVNVITAQIREALVPKWELTSANFRDVFRALMQMAEMLEPSLENGAISHREASSLLNKRTPKGMSSDQEAFYSTYCAFLKDTVGRGGWQAVQPMDESILKCLPGVASRSDDAFREEIIDPIARTPGLISAMGTPHFSADGETYHRFPGPFLPGIDSRLRVAVGS